MDLPCPIFLQCLNQRRPTLPCPNPSSPNVPHGLDVLFHLHGCTRCFHACGCFCLPYNAHLSSYIHLPWCIHHCLLFKNKIKFSGMIFRKGFCPLVLYFMLHSFTRDPGSSKVCNDFIFCNRDPVCRAIHMGPIHHRYPTGAVPRGFQIRRGLQELLPMADSFWNHTCDCWRGFCRIRTQDVVRLVCVSPIYPTR